MISNAEQIKAAAKISEVISGYIKLKRHGADFKGLCPFHNEKTPSFTVSDSKDLFKCFGCGKSGDAVAFLMDYNNMNYVEALKTIASRYNIFVEEETKQKTYDRPQPRKQNLTSKPQSWLNSRGISNETIQQLGVTESNEWMPLANKEIQVVCFNYIRDGELVNIKFRGGGKDFKLNKNSELIFYNLDAIKNTEECIIVEGEVDALTFHECGFKNVVSVPNGAATGNLKLDYLDNCWQYFENKKRIIIATDNDAPGLLLREELARRLGKERCFKVEYPEGCKDVNEVLLKHKNISSVIKTAIQWPIEGIITVDEMSDEVVYFYEHGYPKGVDAKIEGFDEYLTFMPGQLTIVTGIPGSGKSEFIDYLMTKLSFNHSWPFAICSFENQPSSLHVTKLMEKFAGKAFGFRKDLDHRMSRRDFDAAMILVDNFYHFININQVDVSLSGILNKCRELVVRKGIKGLLIDPWNYIEHKVPEGYTETQYISECLTDLKSFAVKNGVHVFLVAHPSKMQKDKRTGKHEIPTMYSISGSAHFFNKADNGICVSRDFTSNLVEVYIQKVRYSWLGKIGFCTFTYDTFLRQYTPLIQ